MSDEECLFEKTAKHEAKIIELEEEIEDFKDRFDRIFDTISEIKKPLDLEVRSARAIEVLDKFDNYMKNLEKSNIMVNELKGQVALVRSSMLKTEKYQSSMHEKYKKAMKILFNGMKDTDSE